LLNDYKDVKRLSEKAVLESISDSGGIITTIARRLHVNWNTARTYCNKWESTRQALQEEVETTLDIAEMGIINAIKNGDTNTIKWYLSTKGKHRGYTTEVLENLKTDTEPLHIIFTDQDGNGLFNADNVEINTPGIPAT